MSGDPPKPNEVDEFVNICARAVKMVIVGLLNLLERRYGLKRSNN